MVSRIIQTFGVGKERNYLVRAIVIAIRGLMKQQKPDKNSKDLAAFIALALDGVIDSVERTVAPWEKRDYWLKADKFRRDWAWANRLAPEFRVAVLAQDWLQVAGLAAEIGGKLSSVQVSDRHRMGKPWVGAWEKLISLERAKN